MTGILPDKPCSMCRSTRWCGRQCANAPTARRHLDEETVARAEARHASVLEAIKRGERREGKQAFRDRMNRHLLEANPHVFGARHA
jgi:hypothetical protein